MNVKPNRKYYFSPLRYPGGKAALYPLICNVLEKNLGTDITYVEPYAGGSAVGLALLLMEKVSNIVINDYDYAIYCFWKSMLNESDRFIKKIETTDVSIKEWEKQKRIYSRTKSEFSLGFSTFFLNRTNFSGIIHGRPIGGFGQNGRWKIDARYNKETLISRVRKIAYYKNRIKVENIDGVELIKKYSKKNNVFVYLDPPYYVKGSSLYLNSYAPENHQDLANSLQKQHKLRWMLTYDNVKEIRDMYKGFVSVPFEVNYSANKIGKGKEVMFFSNELSVPEF